MRMVNLFHTLDVGCGAHPVGDVNCDLLVPMSDLKLVPLLSCWEHPQNFVKADVRFLPFKPRSFDVVYCSHLLEHLEDPGLGLAELKRVSSSQVVVILPFALFRIFDIFLHKKRIVDHMSWLRKHHKHFFLMDPLKTGSFKLMFPSLRSALKKEKGFNGWIRIPLPIQTLTVIEVDENG